MPPISATLKRKLVDLAATTRRERTTDFYISSATGHQINESGGGGITSYREQRTIKLKTQFSEHATKTRALEKVFASGKGQQQEEYGGDEEGQVKKKRKVASPPVLSRSNSSTNITTLESVSPTSTIETTTAPPKIFTSCTIYINGNTNPSGISDIELKRLLTKHGATISLYLARKTVTHVILTSPPPTSSSKSSSSSSKPQNANITTKKANLSSKKFTHELAQTTKSKSVPRVNYVSVDWVLSSIKAGRRLAESKFPVLALREARQRTLKWGGGEEEDVVGMKLVI